MTDAFPRPGDLEMLGLEFDAAGRVGRFELVPRVARHDGGLYGGTAIAASLVAMEAASGRGALWVTTQYVSTSSLGDTIECVAQVLAVGRHVSQVQVIGRQGDRVLFISVGSTATPRPDGLEGQWETMPRAAAPEETEPMSFGFGRTDDFRGFTEQVEYRLAEVDASGRDAASLAMWARLGGERPITAAAIAFMADMVPGAIAREAGLVGGGTSLDNSLRFGRISGEDYWVLLEMRGHMAVGAHAHGSVRVWSRDGVLLAVGGQSANMIHMVDRDEFARIGADGEGAA